MQGKETPAPPQHGSIAQIFPTVSMVPMSMVQMDPIVRACCYHARALKGSKALEGVTKSQLPLRLLGVDICRPLHRAVPKRATPSSSLACYSKRSLLLVSIPIPVEVVGISHHFCGSHKKRPPPPPTPPPLFLAKGICVCVSEMTLRAGVRM